VIIAVPVITTITILIAIDYDTVAILTPLLWLTLLVGSAIRDAHTYPILAISSIRAIHIGLAQSIFLTHTTNAYIEGRTVRVLTALYLLLTGMRQEIADIPRRTIRIPTTSLHRFTLRIEALISIWTITIRLARCLWLAGSKGTEIVLRAIRIYITLCIDYTGCAPTYITTGTIRIIFATYQLTLIIYTLITRWTIRIYLTLGDITFIILANPTLRTIRILHTLRFEDTFVLLTHIIFLTIAVALTLPCKYTFIVLALEPIRTIRGYPAL